MKELYVVRDVPRYEEECSNYCYVVKAESHAEAIDIVRKKTKHQWDWEAELADNKEVWEQINRFMGGKEINIIKKLQIVLEVEIDEEAIKERGIDMEEQLTTEEYIENLIVQENDNTDNGAIMILNEDEEYYDMNIGSCRTMKNPKIVNMTTIQ